MIKFFLSGFGTKIAGVLAAFIAAAGALFAARRSGRTAERNRQIKKQVETLTIADGVERDVDAMDREELDKEADKWARD